MDTELWILCHFHVSLNSDLLLIYFQPFENINGTHIWHAIQNRQQAGSGPKAPWCRPASHTLKCVQITWDLVKMQTWFSGPRWDLILCFQEAPRECWCYLLNKHVWFKYYSIQQTSHIHIVLLFYIAFHMHCYL